ncbi:septin-5-like [Saccoglossus kowalevskii]|uniref:Septin-5-like n=1 Tax=Saccoglossus kowalevskii TaxID=10224 RepID=A0ABM0GJ36_SACKO|nr:PREDICTED: septin-5-like [Saccoglossus kowalevskii]
MNSWSSYSSGRLGRNSSGSPKFAGYTRNGYDRTTEKEEPSASPLSRDRDFRSSGRSTDYTSRSTELSSSRSEYSSRVGDLGTATRDLNNHGRSSSTTSVSSSMSSLADKDSREYVGFATLPDQVHRKSVKKGFEFTLMVVGESGLGKSTLVNSLFLTDLYKDRILPSAEERISKTVLIQKSTVEIEEQGIKLRLNVVDTPGFGDTVDGSESWKPIKDYIDKQYEQYFQDESGLNRKNIVDNRVHCCLYFISPYGRGLRPIDVEFMKQLHTKVNIVPVIAKADCLTPLEVQTLKRRILDDLDVHGIQIYEFPDCDSDEDEDFKQQDKELKASTPFAVIGSNTIVEANGKRVRGRLYPWGIVEVENPKHCDFVKLRNMLIRTHMHDLKEVTCDIHYENYRLQRIKTTGHPFNPVNARDRNKLKRDSAASYDGETDRLLLEKDEEIKRMQDMLQRMQDQMKSQGMNNNNNNRKPNGRVSSRDL